MKTFLIIFLLITLLFITFLVLAQNNYGSESQCLTKNVLIVHDGSRWVGYSCAYGCGEGDCNKPSLNNVSTRYEIT